MEMQIEVQTSNSAQFGADKPVQADPLFGGFESQAPVDIGRDADDELPAEILGGDGKGRGLSVLLHVPDDIIHDLTDAPKRGLRALGQPAEAGELDAQADIFSVLFRPGDPIRIPIMI
jgi:hypothetical protein